MNSSKQRIYSGYILAFMLTAVAILLRWLMAPLFDDGFRLIFLYGAVAITVWYGGYRPALLATLLGYLVSNYLFIGASDSFDVTTETIAGFAAYFSTCAILMILGEATRRANMRIKKGDETLKTTLASIVDAVIALDEGGKIAHLNQRAAALTGYSAEEALGKDLHRVFHIVNPLTRESIVIARSITIDSPLDLSPDSLLCSNDGAEYFIQGRVDPIANDGEAAGYLVTFRDITEQRRKEQLLHRSERELTDFFDNAVFGIHWLGPDGEILRANQAELDLLGYSRSEYVGRHISEFHVAQDGIADMLKRVRAGEVLRDFPAQLRRKDGGIEDVLISCNALFDEGKFVHSRCFTRVITERKMAEETRARLAAIVAASDDAIVSKSLDGTIRSWNSGAQQLLGYSEEEMIGKPINIIIPPELQDEEVAIIANIRSGKKVRHFETVRLTKDGRRIDLSLTVSPIFNEEGQVIGASKVARDITERKQAERRFRLMADAAPVLIRTADVDRNCNWFNKQWLAFTGRSMDQEIGDGWTNNLHPDDAQQCLEAYRSSFDARQQFLMEYRLRRHDGEYHWMLDRGLPLYGHNDRFIGYIGCCVDINDRKQAEEALREADRRKDDFLATLAHELRNPLAPISHSLEILKQAEQHPELINQSRAAIERQMTHMVRLVDDLLNISRISQDKLTLRTSQTELSAIVRQAVETSQPLMNEFDHKLHTELPEQPVYLQADPVRLAQVLSNLLNNACKYTPHGGNISLIAQCSEAEVRITVKDNGVGLASEQLDVIFDMFSQIKAVLPHSNGGLGIGLTLAKRLVEMHGGHISAHSDGLGCGSEFVVCLPALASAEVRPPKSRPEQTHAQKQRILIVDDNVDSAHTLATLLRLSGHNVQLAYDGETAVKIAKGFRPHLLLLDIGLPGIDGYETCRQIRRQSWGNAVTVAALTGWGQEEDRRKSREAGFDIHLVKPVRFADVHKLLERKTVDKTASE